MLATLDENFDSKKAEKTADIVLSMLGFMVVVPSNPEASFFQLTEGVLGLLKNHQWGPAGALLKGRILVAIVSYLGAQ